RSPAHDPDDGPQRRSCPLPARTTSGPHAMSIGPDGLVGINLELTDSWLDCCHLRQRDLAVEYRLLDSMGARLLGLRLAAAVYGAKEVAEADVETATLELVACLVRD